MTWPWSETQKTGSYKLSPESLWENKPNKHFCICACRSLKTNKKIYIFKINKGFRYMPVHLCIVLPKTPTWNLILHYTAGRSPHSSGVAGQDRSAASPLSSKEGYGQSRMGWALIRSDGWNVPPQTGKWLLIANWCLRKEGKRNMDRLDVQHTLRIISKYI